MQWVWGGIGLVCGSLGALLVSQWCFISFDGEVNIIDLASLLTTLVLTILVGVFGQKHFADLRAEKDLLIGQANQVLECIRSTQRAVDDYQNGEDSDGSETLKQFERLGIALTWLGEMVELSQFDCYNSAQRRSDYIDYRRMVTGGYFPSQKLDLPSYNNARDKSKEIERTIHKFIFDVNRG